MSVPPDGDADEISCIENAPASRRSPTTEVKSVHALWMRLRREEGQAMVEYGILVALISIAAIAVILLIGPQLTTIFQNVLDALSGVA